MATTWLSCTTSIIGTITTNICKFQRATLTRIVNLLRNSLHSLQDTYSIRYFIHYNTTVFCSCSLMFKPTKALRNVEEIVWRFSPYTCRTLWKGYTNYFPFWHDVKNVEDVVKEIRLIITTRTEILPLSKCKPNGIAEGIYKQLSQRWWRIEFVFCKDTLSNFQIAHNDAEAYFATNSTKWGHCIRCHFAIHDTVPPSIGNDAFVWPKQN